MQSEGRRDTVVVGRYLEVSFMAREFYVAATVVVFVVVVAKSSIKSKASLRMETVSTHLDFRRRGLRNGLAEQESSWRVLVAVVVVLVLGLLGDDDDVLSKVLDPGVALVVNFSSKSIITRSMLV